MTDPAVTRVQVLRSWGRAALEARVRELEKQVDDETDAHGALLEQHAALVEAAQAALRWCEWRDAGEVSSGKAVNRVRDALVTALPVAEGER